MSSVEVEDGIPVVEIDKSPTVFHWGLSLQYSLPYMNANVLEVGGPEFLRHLIPLVEVNVHHTSREYPLWRPYNDRDHRSGNYLYVEIFSARRRGFDPYQFGKRKTCRRDRDSCIFYLDDIFPDSIGRPLFAPPDWVSAKRSLLRSAPVSRHAPFPYAFHHRGFRLRVGGERRFGACVLGSGRFHLSAERFPVRPAKSGSFSPRAWSRPFPMCMS